MKRQLSLVLALVMILGTFSSVFAANTVDADAAKVASDLLVKEGVLVGDTQGNLNLDKNLLRQDTVVLVSKLMGEHDVAKVFPTAEGIPTYTDVRDKFYLPLLAWAQANKTFEGHSEAKFGFGENLKAQEYAKVLLVALDYTVGPNGDKDVSWKDALAKAKELGILKDVEVEDATEILRSQMAVMTFNALGVNVKGTKQTLAEKLNIKMPAPAKAEKLEAEVLEVENLAEIVVKLSNIDLVKSQDALLDPANYRIDKDATVQHVHLDGDNVVLTLVPYGKVSDQGNVVSLIKGKKYKLTIRNIDPAINKEYKGIEAKDNAIPSIEKVEFMGTHGIKVVTSEPIYNPLERNFRIDKRTSMIVEQYGRNIVITPYDGKSFSEKDVELTIDKLIDFAGYTSVQLVEKMELSKDDALPKVKKAYRSGKELVVEFDRDIYHDSVKAYESRVKLGNASFVERRVTFNAKEALKVDTNKVKYVFDREIPKDLEVRIEGVKNHFDKEMEKEDVVPAEYKDDFAPVVIKSPATVKVTKEDNPAAKNATDAQKNAGYRVSTQEMTIEFDKDIYQFTGKASDIRVADYFTLYELDITRRGEDAAKDVKITVSEAKNDKIKLTFSNIKLSNKDRDYDYILEVRDLSDNNRNRMGRDYLDFRVVTIGTDFDVVRVEVPRATSYFNRRGVEIKIVFNDIVNKEEAQDAKNYYLNNKLDVDEAIVERDGKTVSLVVYDKTVAEFLEKYQELEISPRVIDNSGDENSVISRFWNLDPDNKVNKAKLTEILEEANAKVAADYTKVTFDALVAAKALPEVTQADVDAKVIAIRKAIDALIPETPADLAATYETGGMMGAMVVRIILNNEAQLNNIDKITINGTEYTNHEVLAAKGIATLTIEGVTTVETISITMVNGDVVTPTAK